jgi:hypothetical protein
VRLSKALSPVYEHRIALARALRDWCYEAEALPVALGDGPPNAMMMTHHTFLDFLFNVADSWCLSVHSHTITRSSRLRYDFITTSLYRRHNSIVTLSHRHHNTVTTSSQHYCNTTTTPHNGTTTPSQRYHNTITTPPQVSVQEYCLFLGRLYTALVSPNAVGEQAWRSLPLVRRVEVGEEEGEEDGEGEGGDVERLLPVPEGLQRPQHLRSSLSPSSSSSS